MTSYLNSMNTPEDILALVLLGLSIGFFLNQALRYALYELERWRFSKEMARSAVERELSYRRFRDALDRIDRELRTQ